MTTLKYLDNTYLFESQATFIETRDHEKGRAIILDQTIFYPQGGGQPADRGEISTDNTVFIIFDVRLDEEGTVWHFGEYRTGEFRSGDKVNLKIDKDRRILNARNHTAGHLLDVAVTKLGIGGFKPIKGFHFPDGPYVEYYGTVENQIELLPKLQEAVDELISQDLLVERNDLTSDEAQAQGIHAPPGKSARVVNFMGYAPCGCGGTHVNSASEIGKITIRKIKSNQGTTRIAYLIS